MTTQAAIITEIGSAPGTYLSYGATDGVLKLDTQALEAWVVTAIHTTVDATVWTNKPDLYGQVPSLVRSHIAVLAATLSAAHWATTHKAEWPAGSTDVGKTRITATLTALADLRTASAKLTADYDLLNARLATNINDSVMPALTALFPTPTTRLVDTRFYVTTLVTDWGEESSPSPVSDMLTVDQNDTVTVGDPSGYLTDRGISGWRLYRSNSGTVDSQFQLVADVAAANWDTTLSCFTFAGTGYEDSFKGAQLGEVLPTTTWLAPPITVKAGGEIVIYLSGLVGMANGVMAGYFDNTVCFCEPYVPYAWPIQYQLSVKHPIVGLGAFGQSLFVGTRSAPYLVSGSDSASMSAIELPSVQACVSARSIVSVENGVLYASPDGICMCDSNGVRVVTEALFTRADWQALNPSSIFAALHDGVYYFNCSGGTPACTYALDFGASKLIKTDIAASTFYEDRVTDTLYYSTGTTVKALFADATKRTATYRTGIVKLPKPESMAWLQVDSDFTSSVVVNWYGDGVLRKATTVASIAPVRLPAGIYLEHEIEIVTSARVTSVMLASTTAELQQA